MGGDRFLIYPGSDELVMDVLNLCPQAIEAGK